MGGTFECGVCWNVYDPALGDDVQQIPPGTPFAALPDGWRCPNCDNAKDRYLPRQDDAQSSTANQDGLQRAYQAASQRMRDLPVFNAALRVEVLPLVELAAGALTVVVTPWFMSAVLFPAQGAVTPGQTVLRELPAGTISWTGALLDGVGPFETCSLHSPMDAFGDHATAVETARQALDLLVAPPPAPPQPPTRSRRELFQRLAPR